MERLALIWIFLGFAVFCEAQESWQIRQKDGRAYVPVEQVGEHYRMHRQPAGDKILRFVGEKGLSLIFTANSREATITGVKYWLSFPVIQEEGRWYVSRLDLETTIDPALRPRKVRGLRPVRTVVVDAGHGGHDRGARTPVGDEKNFTLDVAERLKKRLEKEGFRVVMTRKGDVFIPLEQRAQIANRYRDAIFVSIHFNASQTNRLASGYEVFCLPPPGAPPTGSNTVGAQDHTALPGDASSAASFTLANVMQRTLLHRVPAVDRGVKRARFSVLRNTRMPAVLIEGGFLTNTGDLRNIINLTWRQRLADSIAEGVMLYNRLATDNTP